MRGERCPSVKPPSTAALCSVRPTQRNSVVILPLYVARFIDVSRYFSRDTYCDIIFFNHNFVIFILFIYFVIIIFFVFCFCTMIFIYAEKLTAKILQILI